MLIGLISDVHGNVEAMEKAMADLNGRVDEIFFAGDAMHEYRWCNEVVDIARDLELPYILGNHEMNILSHHGDRARSNETVKQDLVDYVRTMPTRIDTKVGGKNLVMVHGTPWPPYNDYLHAGSALLKKCADPEVDFLVLGHTHVPMAVRVENTLIINPGSLGESREHGSPGTVSYAVLDTDTEEVEVIRFQNPRLPVF
ncbi:MAG: metallophosphoesterase [Acidimicrobiia bacterium]